MSIPVFKDNSAIKGQEARYTVIEVDTVLALESWRQSLFSFEWLSPAGTVRSADELPLQEREKRLAAEAEIASGAPLPRPILGIGIMDNIEIGAGRALFLTLAAKGCKAVSVHIPKSNLNDFNKFRSR